MWSLIDQASVRGIERIGFHYGANQGEMEGFQREFMSKYSLPSTLTQLSPVVGTYSGPEMVGVVVTEKKTPLPTAAARHRAQWKPATAQCR
jgi:fatty acid-binding protein DegV